MLAAHLAVIVGGLATLGAKEPHVLHKVVQLGKVVLCWLPVLLAQLLEALLPLRHVGRVRQIGLIAGIELLKDKENLRPFLPSERIGKKVCDEARNYGLFLRPLGDVIVLMPPLSITAAELKALVSGIEKSIAQVTGKNGYR